MAPEMQNSDEQTGEQAGGSATLREVARVITAHQQREGAGFLVRRPFPTEGLDDVDPFMMLDEVGPVEYGPREAIGAPDHPHRGFETISYILQGGKLHEDSLGQTQEIGPGDVQWMTAGAGIIHSELPAPGFFETGGTAHGFQIWVNLPKAHKFAEPGYQYIAKENIPLARSPDGLAEVTVIAGQAYGVQAKINTYTPVILQDWRLQPGAVGELRLPSHFNAAAYVISGEIGFGPAAVTASRGQLALFGPGDVIKLTASAEGGRCLILGGQPLNEPVARYGPFVMNTQQEVMQAMQDYQSGRMGVIKRP